MLVCPTYQHYVYILIENQHKSKREIKLTPAWFINSHPQWLSPTNCLSVFDHSVALPLKGSTYWFIKAFVRYFFIKFLFVHQMIALQKLWKMLFISPKKLFSFSRYSNFCNFPKFPDWKGQMNNLWCHDLNKFADVILGIIQKPLYITSSNLVK